ncbi:hypothetical protein UPYG_G00340350 [Umbra pygmaea]|uniref:Uncharacterized protein n=1 Tax=Umbra pygmaea TaxID=75934 RepID=A0ABD0WD69_UMBPY
MKYQVLGLYTLGLLASIMAQNTTDSANSTTNPTSISTVHHKKWELRDQGVTVVFSGISFILHPGLEYVLVIVK